jgi:hypothetical protein
MKEYRLPRNWHLRVIDHSLQNLGDGFPPIVILSFKDATQHHSRKPLVRTAKIVSADDKPLLY